MLVHEVWLTVNVYLGSQYGTSVNMQLLIYTYPVA